ncbi:MAG: lamin tail domain-containing protein [Chloroflexus sp.]|uniref:lamin tail domain-containing protein n=1 Tax=Chloroflexus sp. TaxID=1904827 RepID=UPI003D0C1345
MTFARVLVFAIVAVALLTIAQQTYAQPPPIACPTNQTVVLSGTNAPPQRSLVVVFAGQPVGGGFSDAAGHWRIPLRVNEPPGIYTVTVQVRGTEQVVASVLCYVDVFLPMLATGGPTEPSFTATATARSSTNLTTTPTPLRPTQTFTAMPRTPTGLPVTNTPTTAVTMVPVTPTTVATVTPTIRVTSVTATVTPTAIGDTSVPTRTPTLVPANLAVSLAIVPYDPATSTSLNDEYVQIRSEETIDLSIAGWRIVNISRSDRPTFIFPTFILAPEVDAYLYTGSGTNNFATGDFYWGRNAAVWRKGDIAHLLDAQGRLVSAYQVP